MVHLISAHSRAQGLRTAVLSLQIDRPFCPRPFIVFVYRLFLGGSRGISCPVSPTAKDKMKSKLIDAGHNAIRESALSLAGYN